MFFLNFSNIWSFVFFLFQTYNILVFSLILYLLPLFLSNTNLNLKSNLKSKFYIISGLELVNLFTLPILLLTLLNLCWSSPALTSWFGHLIFSSFQSKIFYLVLIISLLTLYLLFSTNYFSSNEVYDFFISVINIKYWVLILFLTNSVFTFMFIIEVLSTLTFLLITTSSFSTSFFYKSVNFNLKSYLDNNHPYSTIQSILYFFWMSLLSSLNLFIFLTILYTTLLTLDWFLIEYVFYYFSTSSSLKNLLTLGFCWFIIIFCIFLKCGITPLFIWKPIFFKGVSMNMFVYYILFFYFFIFLFFINFITSYFNEIMYYYILVLLFFIFLSLLTLLAILCESFYFKTFFAVSSILNSTLVILSTSAPHQFDLLLFL